MTHPVDSAVAGGRRRRARHAHRSSTALSTALSTGVPAAAALALGLALGAAPVGPAALAQVSAAPAPEAATPDAPRNYDGARSEDDFAARGFGIDPRAVATLAFDNDLIGGTGDDRQYTSGAFLKILLPADATPWLETALADQFLGRAPRRLELSLGQQIFTPDDTDARDPIPDDRPYGAFLFVAAETATLKPNRAFLMFEALVEDRVGLQVGVVGGDAALGEQAQDFARSIGGGGKPNGYDNGLEDEPGFNIVASRGYRIYGDAFGLDTEIKPFADLSAGTVLTQAALGVTFRIGDDLHYDLNRMDYRSGTASGGWFGPVDGGAWALSVGAQGRAVAHNVFLDGNVFADGPDDAIDVDKETFVYDAHWGLSYSTRRFRAAYQMVWRSEEFEEQDESHVFGTLSLGVKF